MPLPEDAREPDPRTVDAPNPDETEQRAFAEQQATSDLYRVWALPAGRFPLLTILLVVASVAATGLANLARGPVYEVLYATTTELWALSKWWGVFGAVFLHGDFLHLVFNCYWLWILGRLLESQLGLARYFGFFLVTAWFSNLAEIACSGQLGIGLSGVVYAIFGYLVVNRSQHPDYDRVLSGNTVMLFVGWLIACFPLTYFGVLHVANFAHLGGLVSGCAVGALAFPHPRRRLARVAAVGLGLMSFLPVFWAPWHHAWHTAQVLRAIKRHDADATLASFATLRARYPADHWAVDYEVLLRLRKGQYATVRDLLNQAVAEKAATPILLNSLAWLLATCPSDEIRDGRRAVELARRACDDTEWENAAVIDTLAAAYAEAGDFEQAETQAKKAIGLGGKDTASLQEHLTAFQARRPWREPAVHASGQPLPSR